MKSFEKWSRQPSYHGSYGDYVSHMKATEVYYREQREKELVEKIARRVRALDVQTEPGEPQT